MANISKLHYITQDIPGFSHVELAEIACRAGADWIQLRLKNVSYEEWVKTAVETSEICKRYGAKLIINDNVAIALKVAADGVHLGKNDMNPNKAREILGKNVIIGGTANTLQEAIDLSETKVDYIGLGPYKYTSTKENLSPILGIEGIKKITNGIKNKIPVIAIGGIKMDDVEEIFAVGVHGIAVSSAINMADDKERTLLAFHRIIIGKN